MRLAILSDIHGNYAALDECYQYIDSHNIDGIIYLGDYISDFPYPLKTMNMIFEKADEYKSWFIKGNREEYLISHHENPDDDWEYSSSTGSLLYTYEELNEDIIDFFSSCKIVERIDFEDCQSLTICHGSPTKTKDQLKSGSELTKKHLMNLDTDYLLCGHTHTGFTYSFSGKTLINPGSVGVPTNNQTKSQFAILEWSDDKWESKLIELEYNMDKIIEDFTTSGLIQKANIWSKSIIKTIQTGINYSDSCLRLIKELSQENVNSEFTREELWELAAKKLNII